jgi:hypothetical protein
MPRSCGEFVGQAVDKRKITVLVAKAEAFDDRDVGGDRFAQNLGPRAAKGTFMVLEVAEVAGYDGSQFVEYAGTAQALHHSVEVVMVLVEVFEGKDAAAQVGEASRAQQAVEHGEVSAHEGAVGANVSGGARRFQRPGSSAQGVRKRLKRFWGGVARELYGHGTVQGCYLVLKRFTEQRGEVTEAD